LIPSGWGVGVTRASHVAFHKETARINLLASVIGGKGVLFFLDSVIAELVDYSAKRFVGFTPIKDLCFQGRVSLIFHLALVLGW
jgi:hypothetical protein